jgi:hypothetical protein
MASAPQSDADKQLAVWAVTSEMLHKTPEEVLRFVADGLAQQMAKERHDQLDQEKKPEIKRTHPSLSDDLINKLIAAEYEEGMPELRKIANTKAGEQMDSFLGHDKELLISCGFASSDMPIFG